MRILVLHASVDGQTTRIAGRVAEILRTRGHEVTLLPASAPEAAGALASHEAIVVGAAIRYGHHSTALRRLLRANRGHLERRPGAFFSVCLTAGGPGAKPEVARKYVRTFLGQVGWSPPLAVSFAGALRYPRYKLPIRLLVRLFVAVAGGDTDMSREYEYTDWAQVERFALDVSGALEARA